MHRSGFSHPNEGVRPQGVVAIVGDRELECREDEKLEDVSDAIALPKE